MSDGWIHANWPAPSNVMAGTTLRHGNIGSIGLPGEPCWLNQVHGAEVVAVGHFDKPPDADASVGETSGDVCVVRTADCVPVLFCARNGTEIGIAHAGWRGLAAGVIEATVSTMAHPARELLAWLGPAISQVAYEVGADVREAFVAGDPDAAACFVGNANGKWQADLYGLARRRLAAIGVVDVYGGEFCTFSDAKRFFSYRRDADCGRLVSFVALDALENSRGDAI